MKEYFVLESIENNYLAIHFEEENLAHILDTVAVKNCRSFFTAFWISNRDLFVIYTRRFRNFLFLKKFTDVDGCRRMYVFRDVRVFLRSPLGLSTWQFQEIKTAVDTYWYGNT